MRLLPWLVLAISLALASTAEARHFWQTHGSTVPSANGPNADGCGCTWNWNSDYFVPRYPSSCRYGLFSPCKTSCTTSPACKWCHPFYPGYCSIYGPCHYRRRNPVYAAYCGCSPIDVCLQRCRSNQAGSCGCVGTCVGGCGTRACSASDGCGLGGVENCDVYGEVIAPLYNVEPQQLEVLGSIPVDGSGLLAQANLSQVGGGDAGQLLLQPPASLQHLQGLPLQNLNFPKLPLPVETGP